MVARAVQKNLRLIFETPERARMNDASAIALKLGSIRMALFGEFTSARIARFLREGCERLALRCFHLLARLPSIARERFVLHRIIICFSRSRASPDFAKVRRGEFSP